MHTRRYPRTLNEAFGPYAGNTVHPMRDPEPLGQQIAGVVLAIVGAVALAALAFHQLSK